MICPYCDEWSNTKIADCTVCQGTGIAYRWDLALEYYPNIKKLGLTVHDYNCSWMVIADRLEEKLKILLEKSNE